MFDSSHNFYNRIQSSDNILLLKSELGKTKPGIHRLPHEGFAYGKSTGEDQEGARDLIRKWKFHQGSKKLACEPDFRVLNCLSTAQGLSTATEFRTFRKGKDVRVSTSQHNLLGKTSLPEMTFGVATQSAIPIKALIGNFYGRIASEELHEQYASTPYIKPSKWGSTRGFELLKSARTKESEPKKTKEFKMRKFLKTKPRTSCWREKKAVQTIKQNE